MKLLDCTLRDGGYINNWRFNTEFINSFCKNCNKYDIDYVEIGFINKPSTYKNNIVGECRNLTKDNIQSFEKYNFKKVVMADFVSIDLNILKETPTIIDLVRIAFHKGDLIAALETCKIVKELGYKVSVNAMTVTNYTEDELNYLFTFINEHNLDILYIADSYGSLRQKDIKYYLELFNKNLNTAAIGFHLHNNMNNAYSNYEYLKTLTETININKEIMVDSTMFGMGRGAGNLQTELVLFDQKELEINIIIEMLEFIQEYIKPIYKLNENQWGYDLDYLLSGYLKMHPNYIIKMRDLNISMKNRFLLIKEMICNKVAFNYFDAKVIDDLVIKHKNDIL